ncbi:MAG: restriction endonuclease [Roseivirga sp.]
MSEKREAENWMIRAGQGGFLIGEFFNKGIVALGWEEVSKIPANTDYDKLKAIVAKAYPDYPQGRINQSAGQLWRFYAEVQEGDNVVTYDPDSRLYSYGTIESDYKYGKPYTYKHYRKVDWQDGEIERDDLKPESKNLLGSILTLFEIPDDVFDDLRESHPGFVSEAEIAEMEEAHAYYEQLEKEQEDQLLADVISRSTEFVKDVIAELAWDEVEKVVAGILRAMGYKTRMTSRGADLGSDIVASPDGLAMVEPIIKVEVKHKIKSRDKISAPDIRNFVGGLRAFTKGIYVSTTGFSKEARYEAERANFQVTLIDFDHLVELLIEYYEELQPEIKALVPLKRIYWPL